MSVHSKDNRRFVEAVLYGIAPAFPGGSPERFGDPISFDTRFSRLAEEFVWTKVFEIWLPIVTMNTHDHRHCARAPAQCRCPKKYDQELSDRAQQGVLSTKSTHGRRIGPPI